MLGTYPTTFAFVQIHPGDDFATDWAVDRAYFYTDFGAYPTSYFDGTIMKSGARSFSVYQQDYLTRRAVPTDVTISMAATSIGAQTFRVRATVSLEAGGTAKTMRIYLVQVLDRWPAVADGGVAYSRNGLKQAAATEDITLGPDDHQTVVRDFTFDARSWQSPSDIRIIAWAQEPQASSPPTDRADVFQAAIMPWPFPTSDCNSNGLPDDEESDDLISVDPQPAAVCPGGTAVFTVTATQPGVAYHWKKNGGYLSDGGDISGAATDTLTIATVDAADAGGYVCEVTDGCIVAPSRTGFLTVLASPSITGQPPASRNICAGSDASFSVTAAGSAPLTYEWRKDGLPLGAPDSSVLVLNAVNYDDEGGYTCLVSNECGAVLSNPGVLNVVGSVFTAEPQDACGPVGSTIVLTASAESDATIYWAWRKNGSIVSGANTNTLTLYNVQPSDAAQYRAVAATYTPITCLHDSAIAVVSIPCPCIVSGDLDNDGDFDLADMSAFTGCFGPGQALAPECQCANLDGDAGGNVDLTDWAELTALITGPLP